MGAYVLLGKMGEMLGGRRGEERSSGERPVPSPKKLEIFAFFRLNILQNQFSSKFWSRVCTWGRSVTVIDLALILISFLELQRGQFLHRHSRAYDKHCERLLAHGVGTAVYHSGHAHWSPRKWSGNDSVTHWWLFCWVGISNFPFLGLFYPTRIDLEITYSGELLEVKINESGNFLVK